MVTLPSFEKERYVSIYETENAICKLISAAPHFSIYASLHNAQAPQHHKDINVPKKEDIRVSVKTKNVSKKLCNSVSDVTWKMVKNIKYPHGNLFNTLDGTTYIFSSGLGTCGMSVGYGRENVEELISIYNELEIYSQYSDIKLNIEESISKRADKLYQE